MNLDNFKVLFGIFVASVLLISATAIIQPVYGQYAQMEVADLCHDTVRFLTDYIRVEEEVTLLVYDSSKNTNPSVSEIIAVHITSNSDSTGIDIELTETSGDSGKFEGFVIPSEDVSEFDNNKILATAFFERITATSCNSDHVSIYDGHFSNDSWREPIRDMSFSSGGYITVDGGMNYQTGAEDVLDVFVWSDSDLQGQTITLDGEYVSYGFEGLVPISLDPTNTDALFVSSGDIVYASGLNEFAMLMIDPPDSDNDSDFSDWNINLPCWGQYCNRGSSQESADNTEDSPNTNPIDPSETRIQDNPNITPQDSQDTIHGMPGTTQDPSTHNTDSKTNESDETDESVKVNPNTQNTVDTIRATPDSEISKLSDSEISQVTPDVLELLPPETVKQFTGKQFDSLPEDTIKEITPKELAKFSTKTLLSASDEKLETLPEVIKKGLSSEFISTKSSMKSMQQQGLDGLLGSDIDLFILPLQQAKLGIPPDEIACKDHLIPVKKNSNDMIICVTPSSASTLFERGVIVSMESSSTLVQQAIIDISEPEDQQIHVTADAFDVESSRADEDLDLNNPNVDHIPTLLQGTKLLDGNGLARTEMSMYTVNIEQKLCFDCKDVMEYGTMILLNPNDNTEIEFTYDPTTWVFDIKSDGSYEASGMLLHGADKFMAKRTGSPVLEGLAISMTLEHVAGSGKGLIPSEVNYIASLNEIEK